MVGAAVVGATDGVACPPENAPRLYARGHDALCDPYGHGPFFTYYQIGRADESDEAETEPGRDRELKSRYEGSHSPFGFVWQIADATGWAVRYILYGVSYQMLIMMLSDAPRYVGGKKSKTNTNTTAEDEAAEVANFFRSNLKA